MNDVPQEAQKLVEEEAGGRKPIGALGWVIAALAIGWSLFQIWIASPLPYMFGFGLLNSTETRSIHLGFALLLGFLAYPAFKRSPRNRVPLIDIALALAASACALYIFVFYNQLATRPGSPITLDLVVACVGLPLLLEATRRTLGPALTVIASIFLLYSLAGPWMPGVLAHRGVSLQALANHQWLSTEGVFGIALGVSTSFVFLFVLFGALLDRAGAGHYFIQLAFARLGHLRGGPAKASVVASMLTGMVSGSSIANVVTTGTFTIPMMKKVGYTPTKAGAIEVSSSLNGQIMPPVMGAAAFLMIEYVGISYVEVIRHAFLPAVVSYIALFYVVHLEACKLGIEGLRRRKQSPFLRRMMGLAFAVALLSGIGLAVYYGLGWLKPLLGDWAGLFVAFALALVYLGLLTVASRQPPLPPDDPDRALEELPDFRAVLLSGLHFLLPVVVLVWCLMVERLSPGLSAFWAVVMMLAILLTQRPLLTALRKRTEAFASVDHGGLREGVEDLIQGLIQGARNMIGIGIATAAAGIVVGAISQTGVGLVLSDLVEALAMGNLLLMLVLIAIFCVVLGLGLPTTANYIVVSSLMAPVVVELGIQNGLVVPLIAVHMFVFYFGLMADATPPVGLAAYAAAAISRDNPITTGIQAFVYEMRTVVWPFMFIFNTNLLLIDVTWFEGIVTFITATIGMLLVASAAMGWFLVRSRWYEQLLLAVAALTFLLPTFWLDRIQPPWETHPATELNQVLEQAPEGSQFRLLVAEPQIGGGERELFISMSVPEIAPGQTPSEALGLELIEQDGETVVDMVDFGSPAEATSLDFDQRIIAVETPAERWPAEILWLPALLLVGLVAALQRRRAPKHDAKAAVQTG